MFFLINSRRNGALGSVVVMTRPHNMVQLLNKISLRCIVTFVYCAPVLFVVMSVSKWCWQLMLLEGSGLSLKTHGSSQLSIFFYIPVCYYYNSCPFFGTYNCSLFDQGVGTTRPLKTSFLTIALSS